MFNSSSMRGRLSSVARFLSRRTSSVTRASRKNPVRLHLEGLEGRTAPAIFVVTNTLDDGRAGSLRWAITQANADADPLSTINFNIAPSGMQTISLSAALPVIDPVINHPVVIDGTTEPGWQANDLPLTGPTAGDDAKWTITLDGSLIEHGTLETQDAGLTISAGGSTVRGLVIQNFNTDIRLTTNGGDTIQGNFLTGATGYFIPGFYIGAGNGLSVDGVPDNLIGGTMRADRNIFGDNDHAVWIDGVGASGNVLEGNYIGTDGRQLLGGIGVVVLNGAQATVGGTATCAGNVIGANRQGVHIESDGNYVQGNYIGIDATGTYALGSRLSIGVWITEGGSHNTIGGSTPGASNVIAGCGLDVVIEGSDNQVQGNFIGTNAAGTAAITSPGPSVGVWLGARYSRNNTIGGVTPGAGNLISGHTGAEIFIGDGGGYIIQGNLIGTDWNGQPRIPNGQGVEVYLSNEFHPPGDLIGGTTPGAGNTIAFNGGPGVSIVFNDYPGVSVAGIQVEGNAIHDNGGPGVWVQADPFGSADPFGAFGDGLATSISIQRNSIYANGGLGIALGSIAVDINGNPLTLQQVKDNFQSNPYLWNDDKPNSVVLNDSLVHVGANNYQNFPVLNSATSSSSDTSISGTFSSGTLNGQPFEPNVAITLDFYANPMPDPSGYGQGQTYLGSTTVTTDQNGYATFSVDLSVGGFANQWLTATATGPDGSTSEFSADVSIFAPNETFAQFLQAVVPSTANSLTIPVSASAMPAAVISAVNGLTNVTHPVTIILDLGGGTYSTGGVAYNPADPNTAANVNFVVRNGTLDPSYPALAVAGGHVSVIHCTLTTAGDVPTILVIGGNLTLRNDIVQESTGFTDAEIAVTGGTADLGTAASPGGNTINVNGAGVFVHNTTSTPVAAVGATFTVNGTPLAPSSLSGFVFEDFNDDGQLDFGEKGISGVTLTLTGSDDLGNAVNLSQLTDSDGAYMSLNLRPGNYTITETQPAGYLQGIDSVGTAGGSLAATDRFFVQLGVEVNGLNYNYGEQPAAGGSVQHGQTAGIGFWNNKNGQALIKALPVMTNADGSVTSVANWLAATLPHMFGIDPGGNNLTGKSNAYVAALFQQDFLLKGVKLDAQVLATALSVYVTNATLDSTQVAAQYGFTVSGDGVGTATVNISSNGDAFDVANNTTMSVMELLLVTDAQAVNGVLYNGNTSKRNEANNVFSAVNQAGGIN